MPTGALPVSLKIALCTRKISSSAVNHSSVTLPSFLARLASGKQLEYKEMLRTKPLSHTGKAQKRQENHVNQHNY
jgi:hypothetical protein